MTLLEVTHTFIGVPLALITACILRGTVLISLCKVNIYFCPELHSFWWRKSRAAVWSLLQHIPEILNRVKVWTLWWPIHAWKLCLMITEPLSHNLSPMIRGIFILEYAIWEEKIHWWKPGHSQYIQVVSWPINPDQLNQSKIISGASLQPPLFLWWAHHSGAGWIWTHQTTCPFSIAPVSILDAP